MELLSEILTWLINKTPQINALSQKNYFQGGVSESAKIQTQTADYKILLS